MNYRIRWLTEQRGVALPMAMLALLILSALVLGFSVLASTEPTIANNQFRAAQARSLAEAGVEQAIWALNGGLKTPPDPRGIPSPWVDPVPAPYDKSRLVLVSNGGTNIGGFRVTVTKLSNLERIITAVGWVPNDTPTNPHQKIMVTVVGPPALPPPPAALTVRGELQVGGTSLIDSSSDTSCGAKAGTLTTGGTSISGTADIYGADGNNNPQSGSSGTPYDPSNPTIVYDAVQGVPTSTFDQYILTDTDINGLRAYAKAHGTYLQGTVEFSASGPPAMLMPNGLVFIDTVSGTNITQEGVTPPTPTSDFANVTIHGNPTVDPSGIFSGWLFVNGSLRIDGRFTAHGLVYAQNDIIYRGIGDAAISGAVMSRNIRDLSSTTIDSDTTGNARIIYNCAWARNGGGMLQTWAMQPGTYKEVSGD